MNFSRWTLLHGVMKSVSLIHLIKSELALYMLGFRLHIQSSKLINTALLNLPF
jgi:hypothetical protein